MTKEKDNSIEVLYRLPQVLERIPVSTSTWWAGVKTGRFPSPIKLGPRTTCWKKSSIDALIQGGVGDVGL